MSYQARLDNYTANDTRNLTPAQCKRLAKKLRHFGASQHRNRGPAQTQPGLHSPRTGVPLPLPVKPQPVFSGVWSFAKGAKIKIGGGSKSQNREAVRRWRTSVRRSS
jgi:hypothetical protein